MKNLIKWSLGIAVGAVVFFANSGMGITYNNPDGPAAQVDSLDTNQCVWGIDLSHHQRNINWEQIENNKPHFIFFKATEGCTHTDKLYKEYREEASQRNIKVGSYHFFSFTSPGKEQAHHFLKNAKIEKGDLPPVLDVEFKPQMPTAQWIARNVKEWVKIIEDSIGVKPIIYCPCRMYNKYLAGVLQDNYHLWIADYKREPSCGWTFWQMTDKHKVNGYAGNVDYNEFNGNILDLHEMLID